jgi:aspartate aminotransferase
MIPMKVSGSETLALLQRIRELKAKGENIVSFAAGESDFQCPPEAVERLYASLKKGNTRYAPTQGIPELLATLAADQKERLGISWIKPENILVSVGGKQGIHLILSALLEAGDEVLTPAPYWVSYPGIIKAVSGKVVIFNTSPSNALFPTTAELDKHKSPRTKALIMASPNNPSGSMIPKAQLQSIVDWCCKNKVLLIFDELYERLVYGSEKHTSPLALISEEQSEWVVSINALSKAYAMTGWRVGYVSTHRDSIKALSALQSQVLTCLPPFIQEGALAAVEASKTYLPPVIESFKKRRDHFMSLAEKIPHVRAFAPQASFYILMNVTEAMSKKGFKTTPEFVNALLEQEKVAINAADSFGMPGHVRFSFSVSEADITEGLSRLKRFVS